MPARRSELVNSDPKAVQKIAPRLETVNRRIDLLGGFDEPMDANMTAGDEARMTVEATNRR